MFLFCLFFGEKTTQYISADTLSTTAVWGRRGCLRMLKIRNNTSKVKYSPEGYRNNRTLIAQLLHFSLPLRMSNRRGYFSLLGGIISP